MRRVITIFLLTAFILALVSCGISNGGENDGSPSPGNNLPPTGGIGDEPTDDLPYIPAPTADPTGGLPRGEDGILIGSAVLDEPILLIGMPRIDPSSLINVRNGPSLDADRLTQIRIGEVVEAVEIVDGWYHVTVFSDMTNGYVRSDLVSPYGEPGTISDLQDDKGGSNVFVGADPSGLSRGADGVLIGSTTFDKPMRLMGMGTGEHVMINVRERPYIDAPRVACPWGTVTVGRGQVLDAFGVEDGWYRVRVYPGMFEGYVRSDLLVPLDDSKLYLADDLSDFDTRMGAAGQFIAPGPLVDVRSIAPDIEYCIIFATPDNFTGETQYSRDIPLLQLGTALKLKEAQELFKQDGYSIKLYDAYRPSSVSGRLSEIIKDRRYIARAGTSAHNRAAAVDITLVDADGNELEMPSPMHTFNSTSHRDSSAMSDEARANMNYMTEIMVRVGMSGTLSTEWWHYSDSEVSQYLPMDIEFRDLPITGVR